MLIIPTQLTFTYMYYNETMHIIIEREERRSYHAALKRRRRRKRKRKKSPARRNEAREEEQATLPNIQTSAQTKHKTTPSPGRSGGGQVSRQFTECKGRFSATVNLEWVKEMGGEEEEEEEANNDR